MKIQVESQTIDIDTLAELINNGIDVATSPHVGNLDQQTNPHYLALGAGLGVRIEMVDTISVNDRHGRPCKIVRDGQETEAASLKSKDRGKFLPVGVRLEDGKTLKDLHVDAVAASGIRVQTTTEFIAGIGLATGIANGEAMTTLALSCPEPLRVAKDGQVSRDPAKRRMAAEADQVGGIFGCGKDPASGVVLPVSAMSAAEIVSGIIDGQDTVVHIAGSDMANYALAPEFVDKVAKITNRTLDLLGIVGPNELRYIVLDKNQGIGGLPELAQSLGQQIGLANYSQHDLDGIDIGECGNEQILTTTH